MKRTTLIPAGLPGLPLAGSSSLGGEEDSAAPQRGTGLAIDRHTIDGGQVMQSTGGGLQLAGRFRFEPPPGDCNASGNLYQLHSEQGLLRLDAAEAVPRPGAASIGSGVRKRGPGHPPS